MLFRWRAKRDVNVDEALRLLAKGQHDLGLRVSQCEERLDALKAAHDALRGRFYATRGGGGGPAPDSKAAVLRDFGYTPGRPAPHK